MSIDSHLVSQLYRGQRNEPAYVSLVTDRIAQIKGVTVGEVAEVTAQNMINLFRLPDS